MFGTGARTEAPDAQGILYQDARWRTVARVAYGMFLYPLWVLAAAEIVIPASMRGAAIAVLAIVSLLIAACEWRVARMGITVSADGLVLVRPLNRTSVKWVDVERFEPVSYGVWGEQRLRVRRRGWLAATQPAVPTLFLTPTRSWWTWWFRPTRLRSRGGVIEDPVGFLQEHLDRGCRRSPPHSR